MKLRMMTMEAEQQKLIAHSKVCIFRAKEMEGSSRHHASESAVLGVRGGSSDPSSATS